ncbi:uncharacterized protein LOC131658122 [Vicia villosa]|uniref:uncharacterized protein LOC131658122 n=1 Tax=Vicia villosa TaxID=3911 RepID=UPI00273C7EBD|nr:uncharacterized protein LOC131658122 [Vicia villosa]
MGIMAWKDVCKLTSQGGLGMRSRVVLNDASDLKFCWDVLNSKEDRAFLLKSIALKNNINVFYHFSSTIWSSIKLYYLNIVSNSRILIGNGLNTKFWFECLWDTSLISHIQNKSTINTNSMVSDFILDRSWYFLDTMLNLVPNLPLLVNQVTLPLDPTKDSMI